MTNSFGVIIVGLGAMGSAASYQLARRGVRVLGLDRFNPPHTFGSTHGQTRAIRETYFEHPLYVPLVQRAYTLWHEIEQESHQTLLQETGGLMIGPADGGLVAGARESAEIHNLAFEILSPAETQVRYPGLQVPQDMVALFEPHAGVLNPEGCIRAYLDAAARYGATIQTNEQVLSWAPEGSGVRVKTNKGEYSANSLVVSAGAWANDLLTDLALPLWIERQIICWFQPTVSDDRFGPERCPLTIWEHAPEHYFCGFPDVGSGIKVARHHDGERTTAESVRRTIRPDEVDDLRQYVERFMPSANGTLNNAVVCLYTNTPDGHFLIDRHPEHSQVLVVSPCSGHGFKFASAVGEITAEMVVDGKSRFDLSPFRMDRLIPVAAQA